MRPFDIYDSDQPWPAGTKIVGGTMSRVVLLEVNVTVMSAAGVGALAAHGGSAILSGAVQARSGRYRVIMSTGQSPGSNLTATSSKYKLRSGLIGATQAR